MDPPFSVRGGVAKLPPTRWREQAGRDDHAQRRRTERLFFELYSHALLGRPGIEALLEGVVESWVSPIADTLVHAGADKTTAGADARLGVAVVRGLLLDLLSTGDRRGVNEAYERFLTARPMAAKRSVP